MERPLFLTTCMTDKLEKEAICMEFDIRRFDEYREDNRLEIRRENIANPIVRR